MQARDVTVAVDADVRAELQHVVTEAPLHPLARDERPQARAQHAGVVLARTAAGAAPEGLVERALWIGDVEGPREGELVSPVSSPGSGLRWSRPPAWRTQPRSLDFREGLRDTAEVGAEDVSPGVSREVDDSRLPQHIAFADISPSASSS